MSSEQAGGAQGTEGLWAPACLCCPTPLAEPRQVSPCLSCPGSGAVTAASGTSSPFLQTCWKLWRGMAATLPTPALLPELPARMGASVRGGGEQMGEMGSCSGAGWGSQGR